jgi:hypothetical protein
MEENNNAETIQYEKCEMCKNDIKHYNLCSIQRKLCLECLTVNDVSCWCDDNEPEEEQEDIEGDVKHIKKVYKVNDLVVERTCDEKYDLRNELQRENEELKSRLERLEKILLSN